MNLEEAIAIEHFTLGVTLPIIYEQGDNSVLIGTRRDARGQVFTLDMCLGK
jgi:hypothetical protein